METSNYKDKMNYYAQRSVTFGKGGYQSYCWGHYIKYAATQIVKMDAAGFQSESNIKTLAMSNFCKTVPFFLSANWPQNLCDYFTRYFRMRLSTLLENH